MGIFEELGLTSSATTEEVKKAWRSLASTHHPDHGGSGDEFNRLRQVYKRCLELAQLNDNADKLCTMCDGTGKIDNPRQRGFYAAFKVMCPTCKGSGKRR